MEVLEIIVLIAGAAVFTVSFLIPDSPRKTSEETKSIAKEEIRNMISQEMSGIRSHVDDVVDEAIGYAVEKTERSLERLTNEKIMAVNEYSDTVLQEIHKNHEEVLFLYDMLNSKQANLKDTVSKVNETVKAVEETTREAETVVDNWQKITPEVAVEPKENVVSEIEAVPGQLISEEPVKESTPKSTKESEQGSMDINFMKDGDGARRNSNAKILELHKQGKSKVAIAKELGLGVGEVKLVIDLYKNI